MSLMGAASEIKEKALAMGAKVVGIASVEAINRFAPPGHRPDNLLKGAKSVVVLGGGRVWWYWEEGNPQRVPGERGPTGYWGA